MRVFRLKPAATHEELERLTAEYLAAGHEIHRYVARRRRADAPSGERERREIAFDQGRRTSAEGGVRGLAFGLAPTGRAQLVSALGTGNDGPDLVPLLASFLTGGRPSACSEVGRAAPIPPMRVGPS
jgi:hypothetical protein